MTEYVLFGAGTIGGLVARQMQAKGDKPLVFADNDSKKGGSLHEGIMVESPKECMDLYPNAKWVATVHRTPHRPEIIEQMERMGVEQVSLYDFLPAKLDAPTSDVTCMIAKMVSHDVESYFQWWDQIDFRSKPELYLQRPPSDIKDGYFENFYKHHLNEVFVDCGAADGDTVREVLQRWRNPKVISIEPDKANFVKFQSNRFPPNVRLFYGAVSDHEGTACFEAHGDQTSHLSGQGELVPLLKLDDLLKDEEPTIIKMDIEGAELEGLWGARETIRKHRPVLVICAYHLGSHLWEIPLLIHAIHPEYKLYFRRYLEATWELIWYAVPPERVKDVV